MGFGIAERRAEMERRFAAPPTLAQQLSRLCVVTLVQIDAAVDVAYWRRCIGRDNWRSRTLHFFIAGVAPQSVAHAGGLSGYRGDVDRARTLIDVSYRLPLDWGNGSFREHYGLRAVALAWRDGF